MMQHIQKEDDIKALRVYRQRRAGVHLKRHVGLIGIDDIEAKHLTTRSVPKQLAKVTAPSSYIQHLTAVRNLGLYRAKIEFRPCFFDPRRFFLQFGRNDLSESHLRA